MVQPVSLMSFFGLEVQIEVYVAHWQPARTVSANALQASFALRGVEGHEARRQQRAERRDERRRPRKTRFLGDWSSEKSKTACACKTHKESVVAGLKEIITAETLSQRCSFLAEMAEAERQL